MSTTGYLICRKCKQQFFLGKLLYDEVSEDFGFGFWRGGETKEGVSLKAVNFLAKHLVHDVIVVDGGKLDELSLTEPVWEYVEVSETLSKTWHQRI